MHSPASSAPKSWPRLASQPLNSADIFNTSARESAMSAAAVTEEPARSRCEEVEEVEEEEETEEERFLEECSLRRRFFRLCFFADFSRFPIRRCAT